MTKKQGSWVYSPPKTSPKVSAETKASLQVLADELVTQALKPKWIQAAPESHQHNHLSDIYVKWHRHYLYFCTKYISLSPDAIAPSFERKFARIELVTDKEFDLAFMRHTGQWVVVYTGLSFEACLSSIANDPFFIP